MQKISAPAEKEKKTVGGLRSDDVGFQQPAPPNRTDGGQQYRHGMKGHEAAEAEKQKEELWQTAAL